MTDPPAKRQCDNLFFCFSTIFISIWKSRRSPGKQARKLAGVKEEEWLNLGVLPSRRGIGTCQQLQAQVLEVSKSRETAQEMCDRVNNLQQLYSTCLTYCRHKCLVTSITSLKATLKLVISSVHLGRILQLLPADRLL